LTDFLGGEKGLESMGEASPQGRLESVHLPLHAAHASRLDVTTCSILEDARVPSKDTVADMLGQDIAEMAEWYAREAVLGRKLERVVEALDEPVEAQPIAEEVPQAPLRLYAIRSTGSGQFKIGIPKHPESRLQELQVGSPIRLEIVSLTDIESPGAEREAHRALASYHLRGEWFDFGPLGEYVAGRLRPEASNLDALVAALREVRGVVIPARTAAVSQETTPPPMTRSLDGLAGAPSTRSATAGNP
jgi:Meiotically up-regulated gene 113